MAAIQTVGSAHAMKVCYAGQMIRKFGGFGLQVTHSPRHPAPTSDFRPENSRLRSSREFEMDKAAELVDVHSGVAFSPGRSPSAL